MASESVPQRPATNAATPPARLQGWLDLANYDPNEEPTITEPAEGVMRFESTGLAVTLQCRAVDWHISARAVVLVVGRPTLAGRHARAADLQPSAEAAGVDPRRLGGRFAIVFIDRLARTAQLLTDRFAVWPLCWAQRGKRLVFSDRADAVAAGLPAELDPQAVFDYVYFHMIPAPRTVFLGVARLEAATELMFTETGPRLHRTWHPTFSPRREADLRDLALRFRDSLQAAVADECTESAVGCFLSGGTDSSTIAGLLKAVTGRAVTFSIGFDAAGYDEMAYARIVARHFGTEHHEHYITPAELVQAIPQIATHYDQPFGNSSAAPALVCARGARNAGVHKLLAGDGGDELFGGNTRYAKQKLFNLWWQVPASARNALGPMLSNDVMRRLPLLRKVARYVDQASVPMPGRMETYNLLTRFGVPNVFSARFLAEIDATTPSVLQSEIYARHPSAPFIDRMLAYDWRLTLTDNDLPKVTGTTQLAGVEVGFPLLADAIVDLSTELGPEEKVNGLRLRHFFKESLTGFLPPEIIAKKKHGFGLPVGPWLVSDSAFRRLARDCLGQLATRQLIRPELVDDLFSRRLEEHAGYYGEMVWILMMLELWLAARPVSLRWT